MANVQHNTLPNSELHEPKDIATAATNKVYLADGTGSGSWSTLPATPSNVVLVSALTDFPTPVASVITLVANTIYQITGNVNIAGNRLVLSSLTSLIGLSRFTDQLTYTGTGVMFTATTTCKFQELKFTAATGTLFSFTGSSTESCVITNCFSDSCATVGTITTWSNMSWRSMSIVSATTAGLSFVGACGEFIIDNSFWNSTNGTAIDFGTATFNRIQVLGSNRFIVSSGATGISGLVNSGNINSSGAGLISNCDFSGVGTLTNNILPTDIRWMLLGNGGIDDTRFAATGHVITQATTTSVTTTPSKIQVGTAFVSGIQDQFTVDNTGKVVYLGTDTQLFDVGAVVMWEIGTGSNQIFRFYIAKNGTIVTATVSEQEFDATDPISVSIHGVVSMSTNDFIEVYVEKSTGTDTSTARTMNMAIT